MGRGGLRLGIAVVAVAVGAFAIVGIAHGAPLWGPLAVSILCLAGLAFERWRYRALDAAPPPGFEPTAERFRDPASGAEVTVYVDRRTGARRYVKGR